MLEIAALILERLEKPGSLVKHVTDRPGHDRRYAIDASKLERATGFRPRVDFARGIAETIDWYRRTAPGGRRSAPASSATTTSGCTGPASSSRW